MADNPSPTSESASTDSIGDAPPTTQPPPEIIKQAMRKIANTDTNVLEIAMGMGPMANPIHQKMTTEHIGRILELAAQHDSNEFTLKNQQQAINAGGAHWDRCIHAGAFVIFVALLVFILYTFKNQPTVLVPILTGRGGMVAGLIGGFGYAKSKGFNDKGSDE